MSLVLTEQPDVSCPHPIFNCGAIYCFEETVYELDPGSKSMVIVCFTDTVANGNQVMIHGYLFTLVTTVPVPANYEVAIGANGVATALNFLSFLGSILLFSNGYNMAINGGDPRCVDITNNEIGIDPNYLALTFSGNIQLIFPLAPPNGSDPVYKSDYYVFAEIRDVETGKQICSDLDLPLNIFEDGLTNEVCFDLEGIMRQYPRIYTTPPVPGGSSNVIDTNMVKEFDIKFYGYYRDPDNPCGLVKTNTVNPPNISFINFIQQPENLEGLEPYCKNPVPAMGSLSVLTSIPNGYLICKDTFIELRLIFEQNLFASNTTPIYWVAGITYKNMPGTTSAIGNWIGQAGVVHTWRFNYADFVLGTPLDLSQALDQLTIVFFVDFFGTPYLLNAPFSIGFDNTINGWCCDCHTNFMFLSETGNNDPLIASCKKTESLEIEFFDSCRVQKCGEFLGGKVNIGVEKRQKTETVTIDTEFIEYLEQFLASPIKYVIEDDNVWRIIPTQDEYTIYKRGQRNRIDFTYTRSRIKHNFRT